MEWVGFIIEGIVGVVCTIGLVWVGIYIGREYGSFDAFADYVLAELERKTCNKP